MTTSTLEPEAVTSRDMRRREPKLTQAQKDRLQRLVEKHAAAQAKATEAEDAMYTYLGDLFETHGVSILELSGEPGTPSRAYIYRQFHLRGINTQRK